MKRNLFIAQGTLDRWAEEDKIAFDQNILTIKADGRSFRLLEAVRFLEVEGGDVDAGQLLGKVKTGEQLKHLGAERCRDSVIYRDTAYRVQEGFLAEILVDDEDPTVRVESPAPAATPPAAAAGATASTSPAPAQAAAGEESSSDLELLTRFLLKNL